VGDKEPGVKKLQGKDWQSIEKTLFIKPH